MASGDPGVSDARDEAEAKEEGDRGEDAPEEAECKGDELEGEVVCRGGRARLEGGTGKAALCEPGAGTGGGSSMSSSSSEYSSSSTRR